MRPDDLEPHPLARLIPEMGADDYRALAADIKERGLMSHVILYEGKILDGRHRYRACREVGRGVDFAEYTGKDPIGYVLALNIHRRHLTPSQKSAVALEVEKTYAALVPKGRPTKSVAGMPPLPESEPRARGKARDLAAEAVGVSPRLISDVKRVAAANPALVDDIIAGSISVPAALRLIKGDKDKPPPRPRPRVTPAPDRGVVLPVHRTIGMIHGLVVSVGSVDWNELPMDEIRGAEKAITDLRKSLNEVRNQLVQRRASS